MTLESEPVYFDSHSTPEFLFLNLVFLFLFLRRNHSTNFNKKDILTTPFFHAILIIVINHGEVSERFKEPVLKTGDS